jgi:membrane dipeptidase
MRRGKIAGMLGVEGWVVSANKLPAIELGYSAHQLGSSLGALRMYQKLGVKYVTLTHVCHNAFADSAGMGIPLPPRHGGLRCLILVFLQRKLTAVPAHSVKPSLKS